MEEQKQKAEARRIRIMATDDLRNVSYIHYDGGRWCCTLSNGMPASFFYAGLGGDDQATRFALEDCETPAEVLQVIRMAGSFRYRYEEV